MALVGACGPSQTLDVGPDDFGPSDPEIAITLCNGDYTCRLVKYVHAQPRRGHVPEGCVQPEAETIARYKAKAEGQAAAAGKPKPELLGCCKNGERFECQWLTGRPLR